MDTQYTKIPARMNPNVQLRIAHGHFATSHSHINCYMNTTAMKTRCSEAHNVASILAMRFSIDTPVDTILCLDGTEVIGTYLAEELGRTGVLSYNAHRTIYVISPEYTSTGQIIFRDNLQMAVRGKHILILMDSITTGRSILAAAECAKFYEAQISGAAAIFSAVDEIKGLHVTAAYHPEDVPEYEYYPANKCPLCADGKRVEGLINSYGISLL